MVIYSSLEASDIPSKYELMMFSYFSVLFFQAKFYASPLILIEMLGKTSRYSIDVSGYDRHIFALLQEM